MYMRMKIIVLCFMLTWNLCGSKAQRSEWIDISWFGMALGQVLIMPCANEKRDDTSESNFCGFVLDCSMREHETAQLFSHARTLTRVHRQEEEDRHKHQDGDLALALQFHQSFLRARGDHRQLCSTAGRNVPLRMHLLVSVDNIFLRLLVSSS